MGPHFLWLSRRLGGQQTQTKLSRQHRDRRWEDSCRSPIPESSASPRSVRQGSLAGDLVLRRRNHPRNRSALLAQRTFQKGGNPEFRRLAIARLHPHSKTTPLQLPAALTRSNQRNPHLKEQHVYADRIRNRY